jgi:ComF family protein
MKRPPSLASQFIAGLAEMLWPSRSLVSGARGEGAALLLPEEFRSLQFITAPLCARCGTQLSGETLQDSAGEDICAACLARPPHWQRARAALIYDAASRRPVLDLKRAGRRDGLPVIAGWMLQAGRTLIEEADVLVPVPLHYSRLVMRGFNQSVWLANALARETGVPVLVDGLRRLRRTPSQGGLSARARRRNMAGAFDVRASRRGAIGGRRVLLIDDVLTTGATASACARALKRGGAQSVDILVLARVVRAEDPTLS